MYLGRKSGEILKENGSFFFHKNHSKHTKTDCLFNLKYTTTPNLERDELRFSYSQVRLLVRFSYLKYNIIFLQQNMKVFATKMQQNYIF